MGARVSEGIAVHPVQTNPRGGSCPQVVTLHAYEVYCHVYGEQKAIVMGDCRGGFGLGELVAFLYAHSFPKSEWRDRVDEAFLGMNLDNPGRK
jgi:hypothetical protein